MLLCGENKSNKRAEIQESILALNFYMWKRFTGQMQEKRCFMRVDGK